MESSRNPARSDVAESGLGQPLDQLDFIPNGDAFVADQGDLRFDLSGFFNRIRIEVGQHETAFLVKSQRLQVVIGRDKFDAFAPLLGGEMFHFLDQRRPDALSLLQAVQRNDFAFAKLSPYNCVKMLCSQK